MASRTNPLATYDLVTAAAAPALQMVAADPSTSLQPGDVSRAAAAVANRLSPQLDHLTNNEPWYQSRVTWGVIVAGVCTIAKPLIGELPVSAEQTADIVNALATAGQAIGFALTLYGRWRARRPIGS